MRLFQEEGINTVFTYDTVFSELTFSILHFIATTILLVYRWNFDGLLVWEFPPFFWNVMCIWFLRTYLSSSSLPLSQPVKPQFTAQWTLAHGRSLDFPSEKDLFIWNQWGFFSFFLPLFSLESIWATTSASQPCSSTGEEGTTVSRAKRSNKNSQHLSPGMVWYLSPSLHC